LGFVIRIHPPEASIMGSVPHFPKQDYLETVAILVREKDDYEVNSEELGWLMRLLPRNGFEETKNSTAVVPLQDATDVLQKKNVSKCSRTGDIGVKWLPFLKSERRFRNEPILLNCINRVFLL
jgi:hypothetical protein